MKTYSFEKLDVWQCARKLTAFIYQVTKSFPKEEQFGITNQMRRSAVSICSNLAEGVYRTTGKDKARFSEISFCSLMELLNQCLISYDLSYLRQEQMDEIRRYTDEIAAKTTQLRLSQLKM
jgi:four helix bundle protein